MYKTILPRTRLVSGLGVPLNFGDLFFSFFFFLESSSKDESDNAESMAKLEATSDSSSEMKTLFTSLLELLEDSAAINQTHTKTQF